MPHHRLYESFRDDLRSCHLALALVLGVVGCSESDPAKEALGNDGAGGAGAGSGASGGVASAGSGGVMAAGGSAAGDGGVAGSGANGGTAGSAASGGAAGLGGGAAAGSGAAGSTIDDVSSLGDGKLTVGPEYAKDPNLTDLGNPQGQRVQFSLPSEGSIFDGTDATLTRPVTDDNWSRNITVYVPAQYVDGTAAPILVIQEGQLNNVSRALDNLTISDDPLKRLPAFIAIAVANGSGRDGADGQGSERGLEYDTLSDRYTTFIDTEVLPAVLANSEIRAAYPQLAFSTNPDARATMGCSSGGAAALTMGWFGGTFRRIITYSGTFVAQQNDTQVEAQTYPLGAWEYHSGLELIRNTAKKPLRIFIHASENDLGADAPESGHHNWVMANERTAEDLEAKGYHYRYVYSLDSGHCDGRVFDHTLAETLSWVWRGYTPQ
jgi:enterochelin esterase-like enzyme